MDVEILDKLKNFIIKIPSLCECKIANAIGLRNQLMYEYHIKNPEGAFARCYFNSDVERVSILFDFEGNISKKSICEALLLLKIHSYYKIKENTNEYDVVIEELIETIKKKKRSCADILDVFSIEDAIENE